MTVTSTTGWFSTLSDDMTLKTNESFFRRDMEIISATCQKYLTCGDCISASPKCYWCTDREFDDDNFRRCNLHQSLKLHGCQTEDIVRPKNRFKILQNDELRAYDSNTQAIQIKPQKVSLELVRGKPQNFTFKMQMSENFPLDIYFVIDVTSSMTPYKNNLAMVAEELGKNLANISKNYLVGIGTFVDKAFLPFTQIKNYNETYPFVNQAKLTDNITLFQNKVRKSRTQRSEDKPESGLDGIMQAIVCKQIGWRNFSRHLLIYSSDQFIHYAGDGKMAGLVTPDDEKCHLDYAGKYIKNNNDFPTIGQINRQIMKNKVNVIFAVPNSVADKYRRLQKHLEGSTVGNLTDEGDNIVNLIRETYDKLTSQVEFKVSGPDYVDVIFSSSCGGKTTTQTKSCTGLERGKSVTFSVSMNLTRCPTPEERKKPQQITIFAVGLPDNIVVNLKPICHCDCELDTQMEHNSPSCSNGNGTFYCGLCDCYKGSYGKRCQCSGVEDDSTSSVDKCIMPGSTKSCSGRGTCVCGACECHPNAMGMRWYGKYCEFDDFSCLKTDDMLCGGLTRGNCSKGKCHCSPHFSGEACECPLAKDTCIASNGIECNGKGNCSCGRCDCHVDPKFLGQTCEICPSCQGRCLEVKDCAICAFNEEESCTTRVCSSIEVVDEVSPETDGEEFCRYPYNDGCDLHYSYRFEGSSNIILKVQKDKVCPSKVNHILIVLAILGGIIGVAILTIIAWRCYTSFLDNVEYKHYQLEFHNVFRTMHGFKNDNPSRISVYVNPKYEEFSAIVPLSEFPDNKNMRTFNDFDLLDSP